MMPRFRIYDWKGPLAWSKCDSCHHEAYANEDGPCDWCGGTFKPLEEYKPLFPEPEKLLQRLRDA